MKEIEGYKIPEDPKFEVSVRNQLDLIRQAWSLGDLMATERCIDVLQTILWPYFLTNIKEDLESLKYVPLRIEDVYTDEDRERLAVFPKLKRKRIKQLVRKIVAQNKILFYNVLKKKMNIIMGAVDELNLAFGSKSTQYDGKGIYFGENYKPSSEAK